MLGRLKGEGTRALISGYINCKRVNGSTRRPGRRKTFRALQSRSICQRKPVAGCQPKASYAPWPEETMGEYRGLSDGVVPSSLGWRILPT